MEIRVTDADGFDRASADADLAVVLIQRRDIEAFEVGSTVERLLLFSDGAKPVHRFAGRLVLQVEGYDSDTRPLVQIPECVKFFRAVDAQWGYWFHFLVPEQLQLILLLLVDVEVRHQGPGLVGCALRDAAQLPVVMTRLFEATNNLHDAFDVPMDYSWQVTEAVLRALA